MKNQVRAFMLILLASLGSVMIFTTSASAATIGPGEWHQYRLNPENNPVFHSEFDSEISDTIETNDQIRSTPVVVGNNAYIGNHNTGDIYSYNLVEEEMNWQAEAPNWIHSETIYAEEGLFVGFGNRYFKDSNTRGTGESGVLSLNPETGEERWTFETDGEVMPTPAYQDGTVYIVSGDRNLYAVDAESGEEQWSLELGHIVSMSSPTIKDDVLYVGGGAPRPYTFSAIDLEQEEVMWQTEFQDVYAGLDDVPPVIHEDRVITTALEGSEEEGPTHMIYAMDIETGEMVWEDSLGEGDMVPNNKSGAPMVYEGQVFVGSPITQAFYAYDAESGEQQWSYDSNVTKAPPVADDGVVYFTDTEGLVYAFDTEDYELIGSKELGGVLAPSGPILMNDHLITGSQDSNVYALPTEEIRNSSDAAGFFSTPVVLGLIFLALLTGGLFYLVRKKRSRSS